MGSVSVLEDPVGSGVHLDDVGAGGQHGDDAVSLLSHLGRRVHHLQGAAINDLLTQTHTRRKKKKNLHVYLGAQVLQLLAGAWKNIGGDDGVSVFQQVLGHGAAHVPQAHKAHRRLGGHRP